MLSSCSVTIRQTALLTQPPNKRLSLRKPGKTAAVLAVVLSLSACAGQIGDQPLTPAQMQLKQANERFNTTVAEGAVAGAALGLVAGYLLGGGRGALIGAAAGAAVGTAAGYATAQNNLNHSHTEANLQALIQQSNADASAYERSAAASAQIASDLRNQTAQLDAQYAAHAISAGQYQARIASYRSSADIMRKQLAEMDKETSTLRADSQAYGGYNGTQLNSAAGRIDAARHSEEASLRDVDAAMSAVPAG